MTQQGTEIQTTERQQQIITMLTKRMTHEHIATALNVSRSTVERDIRDFLDNDNWRQWLTEDWLQLHGQLKETNPIECYRALTQLIKRSGDNVQLTQNNIRQIVVTFGDSLHVVDNGKDSVSPEEPQQSEALTVDSETVEEENNKTAESQK